MQESTLPIVVFVTDGFGMFPQTVINYPIIWIVTKNGLPDERFPFGTIVKMDS